MLPLLLTAAARADTIQLPYTVPDAGNAQWFVQQAAMLQQQGNQPIFGQAATLTVNGQQPQQTNNTADLDEKTKELSFVFQPLGPLRVQRRIRFEEGGPVRIVDVSRTPPTAKRRPTCR